MGKRLFIAEKPSVAQEFAKTLGVKGPRNNGYLESDDTIVTWCVGHLVTMSYPEVYDPALKKWSENTLPFLPQQFRYEVIANVKDQFQVVSRLLNRPDVDTIYVCTDSGREGEYIYRLVEQMAGVKGKERRRVWIDSQTDEEIKRGIREAKDLSEYDHLSDSAYLRAIEDYLMGINFSRILTLKFGPTLTGFLGGKWTVVSVGRVMTCVLGMVVRREREIRSFVKTPFYRITAACILGNHGFEAEWRAVKGSLLEGSPLLYKENGFKREKDALDFIKLLEKAPMEMKVESVEKKKETKNPPLLFNLAELQNECSRRFKISPDETLKIVQELYEKKMVTYPRTDARVLSTAVSKVIRQNISGLTQLPSVSKFAADVLNRNAFAGLEKTRYVNDKQITDHYAIIPTGQAVKQAESLPRLQASVYELICRRFLSIFFPPAVYRKYSLDLSKQVAATKRDGTPVESAEHFFASFRALEQEGWLAVAGSTPRQARSDSDTAKNKPTDANAGSEQNSKDEGPEEQDIRSDPEFQKELSALKKGSVLNIDSFAVRQGETSPPKRYNSGSMILAMENAGQLIEDEDLRAQIKGSGIGTSATRAEILKKLFTIGYMELNNKTQIITPTLLGELIYDVVDASMKQMLNPELTASWEKGLSYVAEGTISPQEYRQKLDAFVSRRVDGVKGITGVGGIRTRFEELEPYYRNRKAPSGKSKPRRKKES